MEDGPTRVHIRKAQSRNQAGGISSKSAPLRRRPFRSTPTMPFQRYLDSDPPPDGPLDLGVDANTFSANVQFHLPNHILGAPILAPGGGAEVLPSGCISTQNPFAQSWYNPTTYSRYSDDS